MKTTIARTDPTPEERREAVREVLDSQTFARSEQLKHFLRYVCELEITGRGTEIKEYAIGVEALGRPASYSPANDSSVRRRAFELRAKLAELYTHELASSPVIIDLPKGSYVPVFRFRGEEPATDTLPPAPRARGVLALVLVAGILIGAAIVWLLPARAAGHPHAALLREAWGPLASPQGNVLICVASNFYMVLRSGEFAPDSNMPVFPAPSEIYDLYDKTNPRAGASPLFMRPAGNVATLGVVGGIATAASNLRLAGVNYQILPERAAPLASFRDRNVILFGDPMNSFAAAQLLNRAHLTVEQDAATHRLVIRDRRKPPPQPPVFQRREAAPGSPAQVYGLLTILPTDAAPDRDRRTLIVSGVSNVGVQGAMEFFTSQEGLGDLKARFQREGLPGFPRSYQIVVRCTSQDSLPLSCGYAGHYVLER